MALTETQLEQLEELADRILQSYASVGPPVAIEHILSHPPLGLSGVDINDLSQVYGTGERRYEYRLAMGRLLYREILRDGRIDESLPFTSEAAAYFAMALLLPAAWIVTATQETNITLEILGERYQVSRDAMAQRIRQLGAILPVGYVTETGQRTH